MEVSSRVVDPVLRSARKHPGLEISNRSVASSAIGNLKSKIRRGCNFDELRNSGATDNPRGIVFVVRRRPNVQRCDFVAVID